MSNDSTRDYLKIIKERYQNCKTKSEKTLIINEVCINTKLSRKHILRLLRPEKILKRKPGRQRKYSDFTIFHLNKLSLSMGQMNSKKLKAALPIWLNFYDKCDDKIKKELLSISPATMDRHLKKYRANWRRKINSGTVPSLMKKLIPIKAMDFKATEVGFLQTDTVAHCGGSLAGAFAWTVTMVDECIGWTENRAVWCKSAASVVPQIQDIENALPFKIRTINVDGGSEFINNHLVYYAKKNRKKPIKLTRSRPYRKNDNCHVEQKNYTHVRELFGYERIDHKELVPIMNDIYIYQSLLQNLFIPQMRLRSKWREGSKYHRQYFEPKTPYQKLIESPQKEEEKVKLLKSIYSRHNPFQLQQQIEIKLRSFFNKLKELDETRKTEMAA